MNDIYKALGDISSIRRQMASTTEFHGYGPATLASTGGFAAVAAYAQSLWVPEAGNHITAYLSIWCATAAVSAVLAGWHTRMRAKRMHSGLSNAMIRMALEQLLPSIGAGMLLTFAIVRYVPHSTWMLSGLWQVVYSLGVLSSCRFLPKPTIAAGAWYLLTGLSCIAMGGERALSPWAMGVPFAVGQLLIAAILLLNKQEAEDEI